MALALLHPPSEETIVIHFFHHLIAHLQTWFESSDETALAVEIVPAYLPM